MKPKEKPQLEENLKEENSKNVVQLMALFVVSKKNVFDSPNQRKWKAAKLFH